MNVSIKEGNENKIFGSVNYLKTKLYAGGTTDWVPEEEKRLTSKWISKNGTYLAQEEKDYNGNPYYGFDVVDVDILEDELYGWLDGDFGLLSLEDGLFKFSDLPTNIQVDVPPTKTTYQYGESIDFTGLVVKAYRENGTLWTSNKYPAGVIPFSELVPSAIQAIGGQKTSDFGVSVNRYDFLTKDQFPLAATQITTRWSNRQHTASPYEVTYTFSKGPLTHRWSNDKGEEQVAFAFYYEQVPSPSNNPSERYDEVYSWFGLESTLFTDKEGEYYDGATFFIHNGKSLELKGSYDMGIRNLNIIDPTRNIYQNIDYTINATPLPNDYGDILEVLWTALFGDDGQTIKLAWKRPNDGQVLETQFSIEVEPATNGGNGSESGDDSGGEHEGGGGGHAF